MDCVNEYESYAAKIGDRCGLYQSIVDEYKIQSALYPGSHIDIAPSFFIKEVTYVDSFKGTYQFFKKMDKIHQYIEEKKVYSDRAILSYINEDYTILNMDKQVDLIISQFAGFVGQSTKQYLKSKGILMCNDSHGDATFAYLDDEFTFIGVVDMMGNIRNTDLDSYFKFARLREIDIEKVRQTMKGPKYKIMADNYLFQKK